ncbi:MAG: CADD family putative folate metabolism protein [Chloroflexi bacterium]|nr:CADD family putative folate metabolism protein [Chloroflexota bacterium]
MENQSILIRLEQEIDRKSLLTHPFYQAWQAGELTLDDLRIYAAQYYFFESNFPRYLSAIHTCCPDREVRQNILDNLWDEEHGPENHRRLWLDFCSELGLDESSVESSPVFATTQALLDTYAKICNEGRFQEGLAAMYAYEAQVPKVALEKIRGLREFYGLNSEQSLKFFEFHSTLDEEHSAREAHDIETSTQPGHEAVVEAALGSALDAWWAFLDGVEETRHAAVQTVN